MTDIVAWISLIMAFLALILLLRLSYLLSRSSNEPVSELLTEEFRLNREESAKHARGLREEIASSHATTTETMVKTMGAMGRSQQEQLAAVSDGIRALTESNEARMEKVRGAIDAQLRSLQESNEKKLDQMRATVDEKLHSTLERRLGESFKLVSERLEAVQRGLGEMQSLATGVGDLKRVLTNVKSRGTWGEVQLGAILEQILTPDQYATNVITRQESNERVEFAIKLPGLDDHPDSVVWLPIDAKFPQEDFQRLVEASDAADIEAVKKAQADLLRAVESSAKDISEKYLNPPYTTDFAIMFLTTESLYAEVLRQPGFMQKLQHNYRVTIAGPTTLAAFVNSLRMGFRTLAIEQRSSEVWQVLAAVKTEFHKFGDVLAKVKKQLQTAGNTIEQTEVRTRAMVKKLRDVEQLPDSSAAELLSLAEVELDEAASEEEELDPQICD